MREILRMALAARDLQHLVKCEVRMQPENLEESPHWNQARAALAAWISSSLEL